MKLKAIMLMAALGSGAFAVQTTTATRTYKVGEIDAYLLDVTQTGEHTIHTTAHLVQRVLAVTVDGKALIETRIRDVRETVDGKALKKVSQGGTRVGYFDANGHPTEENAIAPFMDLDLVNILATTQLAPVGTSTSSSSSSAATPSTPKRIEYMANGTTAVGYAGGQTPATTSSASGVATKVQVNQLGGVVSLPRRWNGTAQASVLANYQTTNGRLLKMSGLVTGLQTPNKVPMQTQFQLTAIN